MRKWLVVLPLLLLFPPALSRYVSEPALYLVRIRSVLEGSAMDEEEGFGVPARIVGLLQSGSGENSLSQQAAENGEFRFILPRKLLLPPDLRPPRLREPGD